VAIYLIRLADVMGIDVGNAIARKIDENAERFPVEAVRGKAAKADYPMSGGIHAPRVP
jgi:precorrin-6B methylase 2